MKFANKNTLWPKYIFKWETKPLEMRNKLNVFEFLKTIIKIKDFIQNLRIVALKPL